MPLPDHYKELSVDYKKKKKNILLNFIFFKVNC